MVNVNLNQKKLREEKMQTIKSLIVDDSSLVRERLAEKLSAFDNVQVIASVGDAADAYAVLSIEHPDMVVLDIQLPDGNGIDILKRIKQQHKDTIVVMLTNHAYPAFREKCLEAGADYFFDKSTEFEKISTVLQNFELVS
jgi:DNA-binding NarL/FixJ family response regulator